MKVESVEILPKGVRVQILLDHEEIRRHMGFDSDHFLKNVLTTILENKAVQKIQEEIKKKEDETHGL